MNTIWIDNSYFREEIRVSLDEAYYFCGNEKGYKAKFAFVTAVISHTCPPMIFLPFQKLHFGGCQSNVSMTIMASGVSGTTISMSILRVSEWLFHQLLDSSINRNWEIRLIKSFEAPFHLSRSRAMFWSCKFTNSVQPQQHETELNINNNLYYRLNYKNLTANLLRLSLPIYYWQSHLPYIGSADGLLCIQFACLVFQPRLKLVKIVCFSEANDKNFCGENNLHP